MIQCLYFFNVFLLQSVEKGFFFTLGLKFHAFLESRLAVSM